MGAGDCAYVSSQGIVWNIERKESEAKRRMKPLPIGVDDFEKLITKKYYNVDKTLFIKELLEKRGTVNLFTRPRRFEKTLNLSMLRCYFENTGVEEKNRKNRELFSGFAIEKTREEYAEEMCQA